MDKSFWVRQLECHAEGESLPLTRVELASIKEFQTDAGGANFYSLVESLLRRGSRDDAVGLLLEGLEEHPHLAFARATLIRELFERGFFSQAFEQVQNHESDLFQNSVAMRIKMRLQILSRDLSGMQQTVRHMQTRSQLDEPTRDLIALFMRDGFDATLNWLRDHLIDELELSAAEFEVAEKTLLGAGQEECFDLADLEEDDVDKELCQKLGSMFVSKLENVFCQLDGKLVLASGTKSMAVSETLGNVYLSQSLFLKAQSVFERLAAREGDSALKERYLSKVADIRMKISEKTRKGESLLHPDEENQNNGIEELVNLGELRQRSDSIRDLLDKIDR